MNQDRREALICLGALGLGTLALLTRRKVKEKVIEEKEIEKVLEKELGKEVNQFVYRVPKTIKADGVTGDFNIERWTIPYNIKILGWQALVDLAGVGDMKVGGSVEAHLSIAHIPHEKDEFSTEEMARYLTVLRARIHQAFIGVPNNTWTNYFQPTKKEIFFYPKGYFRRIKAKEKLQFWIYHVNDSGGNQSYDALAFIYYIRDWD